MAKSSQVLKFHTNETLADMGYGVTPIVAFFGTPESVFFEMTKGLVQSGFKPILASSHAQVSQLLTHPAFQVGVVMDKTLKDPLSLIQIGKKACKAKWILITQEQSNAFRSKALAGVKVDGLFDYPLVPARVIGKIRQLSTEMAQSAERSLQEKSSLEVLALRRIGFELLPSGNPSQHRPTWPKLSGDLFKKASGNSVVLQSLLDEALTNVVRDFKQVSRVSVVSFGVDQPFFEGDPKEFMVLSSSDFVDREMKSKNFKAADYPEMIQALKTGKAVVVKDVRGSDVFAPVLEKIEKIGTYSLAAIPLFQGSRPFGVLKVRIQDAGAHAASGVLADLNSYSRDLSRFAMQTAFFQRIYRGYYAKK